MRLPWTLCARALGNIEEFHCLLTNFCQYVASEVCTGLDSEPRSKAKCECVVVLGMLLWSNQTTSFTYFKLVKVKVCNFSATSITKLNCFQTGFELNFLNSSLGSKAASAMQCDKIQCVKFDVALHYTTKNCLLLQKVTLFWKQLNTNSS